MKKQDILDLLAEKEDFYRRSLKISQETHNCSFSISLLKTQGEISMLKEILKKFYSSKRIEPVNIRRKKGLQILQFRLEDAIKKRDLCNSSNIRIHHRNSERVNKIKDMIKHYKNG